MFCLRFSIWFILLSVIYTSVIAFFVILRHVFMFYFQVYTACHGDIMDFGSLPWGRERGLPLVLTNVTRANVPVRLVISSVSHDQHRSF